MTTLPVPINQGQFFMPDIADIEAGDTCQMKRWWQVEAEGSGILKASTLPETTIKAQLIRDLRMISTLEDISVTAMDNIVQDALDGLPPEVKSNTKLLELMYRRLGMVVAYALFIEPGIRALYDTIPISSDVILERKPLNLILHPGRLLKDKVSGTLIYQEFIHKPAGFFNRAWIDGQAYNLRIHATTIAIEEEIQEDLKGATIHTAQAVGLEEGYRSSITGNLNHIYVWAAKDTSSGEWRRSMPTTDNKTWTDAPIWDYPGGLVGWVQRCGESAAKALFPTSPTFSRDVPKVNAWCGGLVHRERHIMMATAQCQGNVHLRAAMFPRTTTACKPGVGEPCPFIAACWRPGVESNPLGDGTYMKVSALTILSSVKPQEAVTV